MIRSLSRFLCCIVLLLAIGCTENKSEGTSDTVQENAYSENPDTATHARDSSPNAPKTKRSISTESSSINSEKDVLMKFVSELQSSPTHFAVSKQKWEEYWHPVFDEEFLPPSKVTMSDFLDALTKQEHPSFSNILHGKLEEWTLDDDARMSAIHLAVVSSALFSGQTTSSEIPLAKLPLLFQSKNDKMPPSKGDVITYKIIEETSAHIDAVPPMPDEQMHEWVRLANSRNPFYRLIALKAFRKFSSTSDQVIEFYSNYLSESEPGINRVLAENLAAREDQWSVSVLPQVRAKTPQN